MYDLSDPCEPITGLLMEPFPDQQNKFYVLATTPRRYAMLQYMYMYMYMLHTCTSGHIIICEEVEHCNVAYICSSLQCVIVSLSLFVGFTSS